MLIVNKMYPPEMGGVEVVTKQLADLISKKEHVIMLTFNNKNKTIYEEKDNITLIRLASIMSFGSLRWSLKYRKILKELIKNEEKVIFNYPSFQPEIVLKRTKNGKKIAYYHADNTKFWILGEIYQRIVADRFLKYCDCIWVSNPNIINTSMVLRKHKKKCRVIPLGIDVKHFYYREDNYREDILRCYKNDNIKIILFVGRMSRYKGLDILLKSLSLLPEKYKLVLVSKDELSIKNKKIIKSNHLSNRIKQYYNVSYEELPRYYSMADVFVMPSTNRAEAFGLVAVEAMACGVPVISTELGTGTSFHNIDGITGKVIEPSDIKQLADSILYLCNIELDKNRIVKRAKDFSIENFNEKVLSLI